MVAPDKRRETIASVIPLAHLLPPEAASAPGSAASAPAPKLRRGGGSRMGIMQQLAAQNPPIS